MFKSSTRRRSNTLSHQANFTIGSYVEGLDTSPKGYKPKERKTDKKVTPFIATHGNEIYTIAKRYAKKNGWTIRQDWRGFKKVFDPKTGNVAFAPQRIDKAVWCLRDATAIVKEQNIALMKIWTEK